MLQIRILRPRPIWNSKRGTGWIDPGAIQSAGTRVPDCEKKLHRFAMR
jgi:hypothetical protein